MQASTPSLKNLDAKDLYTFQNNDQREVFNKVIHELRCSVCQNQSLSDSMAPLAVDLRQEIYQRVQKNYSEKEIINFVTDRYGDFAVYDPPLNWQTGVLWFGPFILLVIGLVVFSKYLSHSHSTP